jgi:hypothetical protein
MASTNYVFNSKRGIYGSPLSNTSMNGKQIPEIPKIVTPDIVKRDGGAVQRWESGDNNSDLLEGVSE